jgi:DNA-binding NtrC family response regulator
MPIANRISQILYVGNEPALSKVIAALLKRVGFKVRMASLGNAMQAIQSERFAVIILCATLASDEAEGIVRMVEQRQPGTPIVSVHLGLLGDAPNPASSVVVDALKGPDALIAAVQSALRQTHTELRAG